MDEANVGTMQSRRASSVKQPPLTQSLGGRQMKF
jgi:hypothetical protein